ncbi:hypothetical protein [Streptomyces sp. AK02-01A]|uniref:hypothetical protein n=1 Tax=Streptomyces sp. AK02-01A TaxID=3028648 RepID=UPI0029BE6972|nr:hypothetical protein [Streptomyces sp. AK02-01A]MDX3852406.1 hypothetical protein [Streptomyces sp. AK02-01A]
MSLDPTPSDEDRYDTRPRPADAGRTGTRAPVADRGDERIRTQLWTASTGRPLAELAALISLLERTGRIPGPGDEVPRAAPVESPPDRTAGPVACRSVLRWPVAAVLFASGLIHLPTDFGDPLSGRSANTLGLVITFLCLALGVWLAVQDTVLVWAGSAATAVWIVTAHALSGAGGVELLESGLGAASFWARAVAVMCAGVAAVLAGSALIHHQRSAWTAGTAGDDRGGTRK